MTEAEAQAAISSGLGGIVEPQLTSEQLSALLILSQNTTTGEYDDAGVDQAIELGLRWKLALASEFNGSESVMFTQIKSLLDEHLAKRRAAYSLVSIQL
jgi:hypothetical protein